MAGKAYLDTEKIASKSIAELKRLKDTYGMNLFVDCTPINIGRNIDFCLYYMLQFKHSAKHIMAFAGIIIIYFVNQINWRIL